MTIKRLILGLMTLAIAFLVGGSLLKSLGEPQITNRLELYQTDLLLHATEPQLLPGQPDEFAQLRKSVLGENPLKSALEQYQKVRNTASKNLEKLETQLDALGHAPVPSSTPSANQTTGRGLTKAATAQATQLQKVIEKQRSLIQQLDLRIGILQAKSGNSSDAKATWQNLTPPLDAIGEVLTGFWSDPPRIAPDAEPQINRHLEGWFQYVALAQLYELQQRTDALTALQAQERAIAQNTLVKLALIGTVPVIGSLIGVGLLIFLITQRLVKGQDSILATNADLAWKTPWDWETILLVLVIGFFFTGQVLVPLIVSLLGLSFSTFATRGRAIYALTYYLMMAIFTLSILYFSIRKYIPLPEGWFQFKANLRWPLWGIGGYLAALPLMLGVSLINQQIWQGQGGSNPLLQIVLEEADPIALAIFFFTAAVAAPVFEETLFRGFLLPSLTRYMPVWGAIALSSFIFAFAHLSLSEVLPLTVLGCVLGIVYTRSRNLLAPMLLHSLWNSITMLGLFLLGSAAR